MTLPLNGMRRRRSGVPLTVFAFFFAAGLITLSSCGRKAIPVYTPHEDLLSIAAEFSLLDSQDPYAREPAEDLTGQNIARVTLVRLANYESLHPGRFEPEVLVLKARAYERLTDYEAAADAFRRAAEFDTELRGDSQRRAAVLEKLIEIRSRGRQARSLEELLGRMREQIDASSALADSLEDPFYASLARLEEEQLEVQRAELLAANRWVLPGGEDQAVEALEALVAGHRESRRALEHALRLARFHRELAEEEARLHPPSTLDFDRDKFERHTEASLDLLHKITQADGREERLVARHELDAVLALREMVLERAD